LFNSVRSVRSPYCTEEENYCQENAECHGRDVFFTCQCKEGFKLDGELCVGNDKDSCFQSNGNILVTERFRQFASTKFAQI